MIIMSAKEQTDRDILSRFGFDLVGHLEAMRGKGMGIRNIDIHDCTRASPDALRVWEDSNFPYRLPEDLRAFLRASNGFSLAWTYTQCSPTSGEEEESGGGTVVGRIRVDALSTITRVPLDEDDLRDMAFSRARARAAAAAATSRSLPRRRSPPRFSCPGHDSNGLHVEGARGGDAVGAVTACNASSLDGANTSSCTTSSSAYGIAAFCLDSSSEIGRVALVYGGAPVVGCNYDGGAGKDVPGTCLSNSKGTQRGRGSSGKDISAAEELSSPEVWLQDLSCRWHFLSDSFTSYFRMMMVHLGVLGWQQAFTPVGLSPNTQQCMRMFCPDRLLFDQLEWRTEKANARASREVVARQQHP